MWIFLNKAFISVVEHREDPTVLIARARLPGDLEAVFGVETEVAETPNADYRYRTEVSRPALLMALTNEVANNLNYANFKDSIPDHDAQRHNDYLRVWDVMLDVQRRAHGIHAADLDSLWGDRDPREADSWDEDGEPLDEDEVLTRGA